MKIIHAAKGNSGLYLLKESAPSQFEWFLNDQVTGVVSNSIQSALLRGRVRFKNDQFQPLFCGTRFVIPDRDEHGSPALFHEMAQSLASGNGVYFDSAYGHNMLVGQIPLDLINLNEKLK